jgi:hypothetical protein
MVAALPCNARPPQTAGPSVRLHVVMGRPIVDQVFINGQGPYRFLLDTGAQTNQLQAALAQKLGLQPLFRAALDTAAGTTDVKRGGRADRVSLGAAEAINQTFLFTELDAVRVLSPGIQGVLGQEFLSHFDYLLDFGNRRLTFGEAPPEGLKMETRIIDGRPAIKTSEGDLVLDSGTDAAILRRGGTGEIGTIRTASGFAAVRTFRNLVIRIGDRGYRPAMTLFAPESPLEEDGQLPACVFRELYISSSGHYVVLGTERER